MRYFPRFGLIPLIFAAVVLFIAGCHSNSAPASGTTTQAGAAGPSSDPADANLAPAGSSTSNNLPNQQPAYVPTPSYQQAAPPPSEEYAANQPYGQYSDAQYATDPGYGEQPVDYASQPPPPLPDYDQPPDPGDDYIWTPGYWDWASTGYYWVPGAWVEPPYEGALWTPGYWGYRNHRYCFYRGYWGRHVGYYGGINYGFGYIGLGYEGGYWGGGHFNYNRAVNNVNPNIVHNLYNHPVSSSGVRISYNGGSGGLQVRARPAELAALHETHAAPMTAQLENQRAASTNRAQFINANHGRPANVAVNHPLAADRNVKAPPQVAMRNQAAPEQQRQAAQQHPAYQPPQHLQTPEPQRQVAPQQQQRQAMPPRPQAPLKQQHEIPPQAQQRPGYQPPQRQQVPQPQHQPAPQMQQRQFTPKPQQRREPPPQQQRPAPPLQQRQAPPPQQRQAPPPQQHQAAPQHQAPPQKQDEHHDDHPRL